MRKLLLSIIPILCGLILATLTGNAALAERRVALVIGNSAYRNATTLANTVNDATAIATMFRNVGFDVVDLRQDVGVLDFKRALREFMNTARNADIAVVYYAGHGIESAGTNYLIPVDAKLASDYDAEDEAVSLDRIVLALQPAVRLRLIILDACRDNPFMRKMQRTLATRAVANGLAKVEPASTDTLIAFAAKAGSISYDGTGPNSPFTTALVKYLAVPGLDIRIALGRVRDDVVKTTANRQEPFVYGSLGGATISLVPVRETPKVEAPPPIPPSNESDARRDYELTDRVGTKEAWESFLREHRTGFYADLAHMQLSKLNAAVAEREAKEREEKERADRLAVKQRQDDEQRVKAEAERRKAERDAALKAEQVARAREEDERLKAEAERQKVERDVALKAEQAARERQDEEKRVKAETDRKAERDVALKAEQIARERQEEEKRIKVEADRRKAERDAALKAEQIARERQEEEQRVKAETERRKAERDAALKAEQLAKERQEEERRAEADRRKEAALGPTTAERSAQSCKRDEERLAKLRANPAFEDVDRFARDLGCEELRPQVLRLLESVAPTPAQAALPALAPTKQEERRLPTEAERQKAERESASRSETKADTAPKRQDHVCERDAERLNRLRADPTREEVVRFSRELACEELRPQVGRLLESLGD